MVTSSANDANGGTCASRRQASGWRAKRAAGSFASGKVSPRSPRRADVNSRPPRLPRAIIRASLPADDRDVLTGELELLWRQRTASNGQAAANRWFARQALSFAVRVGLARLVPDRQT